MDEQFEILEEVV